MRFLTLLLFLLASINAGEISCREDNGEPAPYFRPNGRLIPHTYIVYLFENYTLTDLLGYSGLNVSTMNQRFQAIGQRSYRAQLDKSTLQQVLVTPYVEFVEHDHYIPKPTFTKKMTHMNDGELSSSALLHSKRWETGLVRRPYWNLEMVTTPKKVTLGKGRVNPIRTVRGPGRGVNAYVLDTGIRLTHQVFMGRASNFQNRTTTPYCRSGDLSMHDNSNTSHGTGVASLIGGWNGGYSISLANVINVKVFCEDEAENSLVAKAISDITAEHRAFVQDRPSWFKGSIINMSFGLPDHSPLVERVVKEASNAGILMIASAGNAEAGVPAEVASAHFPCNITEVICVTSCNRTYGWSRFANYGKGVDIIAPGERVALAHSASDKMGWFQSGTSLATPIVGSVLANFMAYEGLVMDTKTVRKRMFDNAVKNVIGGLPKGRGKNRTPNLLVNIPTNRRNPRGPPYSGAPS